MAGCKSLIGSACLQKVVWHSENGFFDRKMIGSTELVELFVKLISAGASIDRGVNPAFGKTKQMFRNADHTTSQIQFCPSKDPTDE
jgi:hypothetical protein